MYHYRKTRLSYRKLNAKDKKVTACTLCDAANKEKVVAENNTMFVLPNRISYDVFEGLSVLDHLMLVPKRHVTTLKDFTKDETLDFMSFAGEYESKGYYIYARGLGALNRSVEHQHTHLIKLKNERSRFYLFVKKPYFVVNI